MNEVSVEEVYKEIIKLSPRKSAQSTDIPIRVRMENADLFAYYTWGFFNEFIKKSTFPSILKNENITRVFKKGYRSFKENYRPVSILPVTFRKITLQTNNNFHRPITVQIPNTNAGLEKF